MTGLRRVFLAVTVFGLAVAPLLSTPLQLNRLSRLLVLVLAVLGVNLLTGYTGLVSLGHGVFVGIGAFTMANLLDLRLPIWVALLAASAFTGAVGVVIGLPALRVRGLYLALITFGMALAFPPIARQLGSVTGGVSGRPVETDFLPPSWLGIEDQAHIWRYGVCILVVAIWFGLARNLVRSRMGRALQAIRDDETVAALFGVPVAMTKTGVLAVSAAMAGTAGALQAILFPYVSHTQFDVFLSLRLYAAAVLGGLGTLAGALVGVGALVAVPTINDVLGVIDNESIVFGAGLIIATLLSERARRRSASRAVVRS